MEIQTFKVFKYRGEIKGELMGYLKNVSVCLCLGVFLHSLPVFLPCLRLFLRPRGGKESSKFRHLRQVRRWRRVHQLSGMKIHVKSELIPAKECVWLL